MPKTKSKKPVARSIRAAAVTASAPATGFRAAMRDFFARYFAFNGTSTRAQYWWVTLFLMVVLIFGTYIIPWYTFSVGAPIVGLIVFWLAGLFAFAVLIPSLALMSRRVHDAGFSAWVFFAPWLIVLMAEVVIASEGSYVSVLPYLDCVELGVCIWGLVLALMPGKIANNPYRE